MHLLSSSLIYNCFKPTQKLCDIIHNLCLQNLKSSKMAMQSEIPFYTCLVTKLKYMSLSHLFIFYFALSTFKLDFHECLQQVI